MTVLTMRTDWFDKFKELAAAQAASAARHDESDRRHARTEAEMYAAGQRLKPIFALRPTARAPSPNP